MQQPRPESPALQVLLAETSIALGVDSLRQIPVDLIAEYSKDTPIVVQATKVLTKYDALEHEC